MNRFLPIATAALSLAAAAPIAAQESEYGERSDEAFAELVEGRVAGEARTCIPVYGSNTLRVIDHVGLAYRRGDTLWVARARNPDTLGAWDVPVIRRYGSNMCRHDITHTIDRSSGIFSGVLFLQDWVPYREVEAG